MSRHAVHQWLRSSLALLSLLHVCAASTSDLTGDPARAHAIPAGIGCRGELRDRCSKAAIWQDPTACASCIKTNTAALEAAGCPAVNITAFCAHGICKQALREVADEMEVRALHQCLSCPVTPVLESVHESEL